MAKRISDRTRTINMAMAAESREEIDAIIESLAAIRDNRFPREAKKVRKERKDKGTTRTTAATDFTDAANAAKA